MHRCLGHNDQLPDGIWPLFAEQSLPHHSLSMCGGRASEGVQYGEMVAALSCSWLGEYAFHSPNSKHPPPL